MVNCKDCKAETCNGVGNDKITNCLSFVHTSNEHQYKFDDGKVQLDILYNDFMKELDGVGRVLSFGAVKYERGSFVKVPNPEQRYWAAFHRHRTAVLAGELIDQDSGESHFSHMITNLLFLQFLSTPRKYKKKLKNFKVFDTSKDKYEPVFVSAINEAKVREAYPLSHFKIDEITVTKL